MFNALVFVSIGLVAAVQGTPYIADAMNMPAGGGKYGSPEYQALEGVIFAAVEIILWVMVRRHEARG